MASAMVCAFALTGCGSNTATTSEDKDTFVVGMECAYAPFNWQTSKKNRFCKIRKIRICGWI